MHRLLIAPATPVALVVLIMGLGSIAGRTPLVHAGDNAVAAAGWGCLALDANNGVAFSADAAATATVNADGTTTVTCSLNGVANSTGAAVHLDGATTGVGCATDAGITTVWSEEITADGQATLSCTGS